MTTNIINRFNAKRIERPTETPSNNSDKIVSIFVLNNEINSKREVANCLKTVDFGLSYKEAVFIMETTHTTGDCFVGFYSLPKAQSLLKLSKEQCPDLKFKIMK